MKVIDMHCDTIHKLLCRREEGETVELRENREHIDLLRMRQSNYLLQNFAMFVQLEQDGDPWERVNKLIALYEQELEKNRDLIAPVRCFSDIAANEAAGKLSSLLTVEEGAVLKGEIEKLHELYDRGVRMITLTWNFPNELGYPSLDRTLGRIAREAGTDFKSCKRAAPEYDEKRRRAQAAFEKYFHTPNLTEGLTEKGKEFVSEMERLGMIPDVSHLSDAGFYDVLAVTKKPFVASHSNARAVCPCVRNMTDDMIKKLGERGGCMGLNFCADFLEEAPVGQANPGSMEAVVRHAKHIVDVGGIEALGLGSDFDGIDTHAQLPGAQSMGRLWDALKAQGFTESRLDKIFWQNVLRVYRDTLG